MIKINDEWGIRYHHKRLRLFHLNCVQFLDKWKGLMSVVPRNADSEYYDELRCWDCQDTAPSFVLKKFNFISGEHV